MVRDPLHAVPTTARLWGAAALCVVPLGLVWSTTITPGTTIIGDCGYSDGPYCTGDMFIPGAANVTTVAQAPVRVFLFFAILALAAVALRTRTDLTRRVARLATVSIAIAAVLAAQNGSRTLLICTVLALVLTVPVVWSRPNTRILAPASVPR